MDLTPLTYEILLALADGNGHGYGILKDMERRGGPVPSTGAMYLALHRMVSEGLIEEAPAPPDEEDARRRYYRITRRGREAARQESGRLAELVARARSTGLLVEEPA
ncbi:MAG TPA: PadR family transcriptional regulator [Gemmatimonadota bacterium]|nr:PadR family transcriptional regulator [Gemmatimonadota bacterium]